MQLSELIDELTENEPFFLSVTSFSDAMRIPSLALPTRQMKHTMRFCDTAKSTAAGYRRCLANKAVTNRLACRKETPFAGYCPYGMYELVYPVWYEGSPICAIYIGNLCPDPAVAVAKLHRSCERCGTPKGEMRSIIDQTYQPPSMKRYEHLAYLLALFIKEELAQRQTAVSKENWRVGEAKAYLEAHFDKPVSVKELAHLFYCNEKYLGRLFKRETGLSVREYVNRLRLNAAKRLLVQTDRTVYDIAAACGYNEPTYFTRVFTAACGVTPHDYRQTH